MSLFESLIHFLISGVTVTAVLNSTTYIVSKGSFSDLFSSKMRVFEQYMKRLQTINMFDLSEFIEKFTNAFPNVLLSLIVPWAWEHVQAGAVWLMTPICPTCWDRVYIFTTAGKFFN